MSRLHMKERPREPSRCETVRCATHGSIWMSCPHISVSQTINNVSVRLSVQPNLLLPAEGLNWKWRLLYVHLDVRWCWLTSPRIPVVSFPFNMSYYLIFHQRWNSMGKRCRRTWTMSVLHAFVKFARIGTSEPNANHYIRCFATTLKATLRD